MVSQLGSLPGTDLVVVSATDSGGLPSLVRRVNSSTGRSIHLRLPPSPGFAVTMHASNASSHELVFPSSMHAVLSIP